MLLTNFQGEFGWYLMTWLPRLRLLAKKQKVIILCRPGWEYFAKDFAHRIHDHNEKGLPDRWYRNKTIPGIPKHFRNKYKNVKLYLPSYLRCVKKKRKYIKYGTFKEDLQYDLVIHARACKKFGQSKWNWPTSNYRKLLEILQPSKVCCIGTDAYYIEGTENKLNIPAEDLCNILASSKCMLSPSSAPGHLASLCRCPHVIMTGNEWQKSIGGTNKDRYKTKWNPFHTQCKVLDVHKWQPPVKLVAETIINLTNKS